MVEAFCVTEKDGNVDYIDTIPVIKFDNNINKESLIIIGVLEHGKCKVKEHILQFGEYDIIDLPDGILYTDNFYYTKS